jgi:N-acetylglutamate synthase-like GNAT family acetyltransferase
VTVQYTVYHVHFTVEYSRLGLPIKMRRRSHSTQMDLNVRHATVIGRKYGQLILVKPDSPGSFIFDRPFLPSSTMELHAYSKKDYEFVKKLYISALQESARRAVKDVLLQPRTIRILTMVIPIASYIIYQGFTTMLLWEPVQAYIYSMLAVILMSFMILGSTYQMFSSGIKKSVQATFEKDMSDIPATFNLVMNDDECYEPAGVSNVWIATINGEKAGFLTMHVGGSQSCEIRKMAVVRKHRRLGLGELMTRQAIVWAKDRQMEKIFALNVSSAQVAACELFEKCGFAISKQKPVIPGFGYLAYELSIINR